MKRLEEYELEVERRVECCMGKLNGLVKCLEEKDLHTIKLEQKICDMENINNLQNERIQVLEKKCFSKMLKHEKRMDFFTKKLSYVIGLSSEDEDETTDIDEKVPESYTCSDPETRQLVKCEKCEFETTTEHELQVHQENNHSTSLLCEICNFRAQTQSELEIHVFTCEQYKCSKCDFKSRRLSQVKNHLRKKHDSVDQTFHHLKMDRSDPNKVCDTLHSLEDI